MLTARLFKSWHISLSLSLFFHSDSLLSFQLLMLVMPFSERAYQELQFLVFEYVPSSEKTSVIFLLFRPFQR